MEKTNKNSIKEKLEKTVELSKDLPKPINIEQQQLLDDIMDEIKDLNNYLDEISTVEGTDGKKYKYKNNKLEDENGNIYTKSIDNTDYIFSIINKENGKETKYTVFNKDN